MPEREGLDWWCFNSQMNRLSAAQVEHFHEISVSSSSSPLLQHYKKHRAFPLHLHPKAPYNIIVTYPTFFRPPDKQIDMLQRIYIAVDNMQLN